MDINADTNLPFEPDINASLDSVQNELENPADQNLEEQKDEVQQLVSRFKQIADVILTNYNSDRDQIEDTIKHLDSIVQMGPKVPRVYVEMLVSALRVKTETSGNVVKLLDSLAKLLSAGKNTQIFTASVNTSPADLKALLDVPRFPDEK